MRKRWFFGYIPPKSDAKIIRDMANLFPDCECIYPKEKVVVVRSGKKRIIEVPLFPNYLMVLIPIDDIRNMCSLITQRTQILKFLTNEDEHGRSLPTALTKRELVHIKNLMERTSFKYHVHDLIGKKVNIIKGPYNNFTGIVTKIIKNTGKMVIDINLFGKIFAADVPLDYIDINHEQIEVYEENL